MDKMQMTDRELDQIETAHSEPPTMVIRYGINRRDPKNPHRFLHRNHRITVPAFAWEDNAAHARLCNRLIAGHPGWGLTGYIVEKSAGGVGRKL